MESKLKMYCKLCQTPKSKNCKSFYDKIQRTTECQLQTEAGSVLKIREVNATLDEEETWKKSCCQCNAPVFETTPKKKERLEKPKTFKQDEKINCEKAIKELKPKWLHQFTDKQFLVLDHLVWDLIDDDDEGTLHRVQQALFHLGLFPQPSLKQIQKAMIFNCTNAVLFLNELLTSLNYLENSAKYSYNQRLLMSGIFYLEMPCLLQFLLPRLPKKYSGRIHWNEKIETRKRKVEQSLNPYMQSMQNFPNWQDQRKKMLAARKKYCKSRQRISYPEEVLKLNNFLTHIDMTVIDPELGIVPKLQEATRQALEKVECIVVKELREFNLDHLECPNSPPVSRSSTAIQQHFQVFLQDKDFNTILNVSLSELTIRGMISATYKELNIHPVIIHIEKFINGELITGKLKSSLVDKAATMKHCIKQLYKKSQPENLNKMLPDKTWAFIKQIRETGEKDRKKVLDHLWRQRVACSQNLWHMFSPEYPQVRSFLPAFSAYATSYKTAINFWTIVPKE